VLVCAGEQAVRLYHNSNALISNVGEREYKDRMVTVLAPVRCVEVSVGLEEFYIIVIF